MSTNNGLATASSPLMFHSSSTFSIDESKLCFNKTHFNRTDFNVERFMNLARQKADLKTIQQDLRLYLKSVQNSMIELINDDYADFVHLSSNLVSLQESINKIEQDIDSVWQEFEESTKDSVGTAERIEKKCDELSLNRERQSELRDRIAFLSAIEKLAAMLKKPTNQCSALWLQKLAYYVVEIKSSNLSHNEVESHAHQLVLTRLENVLCDEGVRSASIDCDTLPLVLSILSITGNTHSLTAKIVSDLLYPKFVNESNDRYQMLVDVFENVVKMRAEWSEKLGTQFKGKVAKFLDETLLTFVLTFIEKCMGTVAVPSDTRLFHKCFMATENFIENWPNAKFAKQMLKSIREKFNLLVYFKLETHKFTRTIENLIISDNIEFVEGTSEDFHLKTTTAVIEAIEHVWSDDVYIPLIVDKLWDFTLRHVLKHYSWTKTMHKHILEESPSEAETVPKWKKLLSLRTDAEKLQARVFDFALESIWTKLGDIGVDTSQFGKCLTKHGKSVDELCSEIDKDIVACFAEVLNKELAQVSDVPKQYRWTKKPAPSTNSSYVKTAVELVETFRERLEKEELINTDKMIKEVCIEAFKFFVVKAKDVQDSVEATGSSLSRFKRKNTPDGSVTDDDKIKTQIYHDAAFLLEKAKRQFEIDVDGLEAIVKRFKDTINRTQSEVKIENVDDGSVA